MPRSSRRAVDLVSTTTQRGASCALPAHPGSRRPRRCREHPRRHRAEGARARGAAGNRPGAAERRAGRCRVAPIATVLSAGPPGRRTGPRRHLAPLPTSHDLEPVTKLDGSPIRELAGPSRRPPRHQTLAEATVPPRGETEEHLPPRHRGALLLHRRPGAPAPRRRGARRRRRRLRGHPAGHRTSCQHRRRAARAPLLLRAGLHPRGHRPHGGPGVKGAGGGADTT